MAPVQDVKYTVSVRGMVPDDIAERVATMHAEAVKGQQPDERMLSTDREAGGRRKKAA